MRTLPRRFDDFETSVRFLERRCAETGVSLVLPQVWQRTNPFA